MKRTITFAMALLTAVLTACGTGAVSDETKLGNLSEDVTTDTGVPTRLDELGAHDFGGKQFILCNADDYPTTTMNIPKDENAGDVINDAVYKRNSKISELYNFTMTYLSPTSAKEGTQLYSQSYLAGDHYCDFILSTVADKSTLQNLAAQSMLANLRAIEEISLNKPWWSVLTSEALTLNGKTYFTTGDISPHMYSIPVIIAVNLELAEEYNVGYDYYELVKNGEWTYDKLFALTKFNTDLDGDNDLHTSNDFFGYVGDSTGKGLSAGGFVIGMGVDLSSVENGELTVQLSGEKAADVVSLINKLVPKESMADRRDYINKTFKENRALAIQGYLGKGLRDMESSFYYLPMPKYDAKQEDYRCLMNGWGAAFTAIPADADLDFVGPIVEALAYDSYTNVRPAIYDIVLMQKVARDDKAAELIDTIFGALYLDFNALYNFGGTLDSIANSVYNDAPFSSSIASKKSATDEAIQKLTETW